MHHIGGGYSDIKGINHSWIGSFDKLNSNVNILAMGYQEVGRWGIGNIYKSSVLLKQTHIKRLYYWLKYRWFQLNYKKIIGNGAFICKPKTSFTTQWWDTINSRLDSLYADLLKNPAKYPKDYKGNMFEGKVSTYAVPWSYILADIFQPLSFKFNRSIDKTLPPPSFKDYQ
jgi:hypothetical protein